MTLSQAYRAPFAPGGDSPVDAALCERLLATALSRGGEYADLFFEYRAGGGFSFDEGILKAASRGVSLGLGVRVQRGVTLHGFALNCDPELGAYEGIVACGLADAGVTSLTRELGRRVTVEQAIGPVEAALREAGLAGHPSPHPSPSHAAAEPATATV